MIHDRKMFTVVYVLWKTNFHKLSRLHSLFQALVRQLWENLHNRLLSRFLSFPTKLRDDVTRQ